MLLLLLLLLDPTISSIFISPNMTRHVRELLSTVKLTVAPNFFDIMEASTAHSTEDLLCQAMLFLEPEVEFTESLPDFNFESTIDERSEATCVSRRSR